MTPPTGSGSRGRPRDPSTDRAILRAALDLFLEQGPEGASVEQIAKRAGVARLTVYRRWATKDELLLAAIDHAREIDEFALFEDFTAASGRGLPLDAIVEHLVRLAADPRSKQLVLRLIGTSSSHPDLLRAFWDTYLWPRRQRANARVLELVEQGSLPADTDPDALTDAVLGALLYRILLYPDAPTAEELRDRVRAVFRQVGLGPAG
ncbi:TetR/AcrR family transcriptional regulator [Amycolatopsis benzoatilytica]|uniref:TetR/AcrR family transcriptional regulator n=1 Tax=Amycolatopsis benzoatilytica TaxID=346045 RepID=UPI00036330AD|nr:TetR/AcrR family transcriptional regulator [Amycolatopsis benzoatilytica]